MALKTIMLRRKIDLKKKDREALREKDKKFETREAELETAIAEAQTQEEQDTVAAEVEQFEADKKTHTDAVTTLEGEIADLERQLQEEEQKQPQPAKPTEEERKDEKNMNTRHQFFGMNMTERTAFFADQQVKDFLGSVRTCIKEKRAIENVGLTIPEVALPLLKQVVAQTSKLLGRVFNRHVAGTGRQRIMGQIPEAIWTEMYAKLNEMSLGFNDVEVDGYKVGGFFAVANAVLEDNDVNLMSEILEAIGKAIGKALDKAIVYGTGVKMPMGVVTRLAQTAKPADYSTTAREWKKLSDTHIITGKGKTGLALFQEIVANTKVITNDYFEGGMCFLMNKATYTDLTVQSMDKNLNAAIVAGINNTMPVIGGDIIELPFIPDGNIVYGYFDAYLLAERAGTVLGQSEHVRFLEDQTVFKGTARYDGEPVIPEAFGVMSITTTAPATSVSFPGDTANAAAAG